VDRVPAHQQLVHRVLRQLPRIVGVRVPQSDREHPLPEQLGQRVRDLPRLPRIAQAARQGFRQPERPVHPLQEHRAPVRAAVLLLQLHDQRLRGEVRKQNSLCGRIVAQEKALLAEERVSQRVSTAIGAFFNSRARFFVNYPA